MTTEAGRPGPSLPQGYGIVFVTTQLSRWEHWRGPVFAAISRHIPVLMIHPLGARRGYTRLIASLLDRGALQPVRRLGDSRFELDVAAMIPGGRFWTISKANQVLVARYARQAMQAAGIARGAFWFQHPTWQRSGRRLSDLLVSVYDCDDLYESFPDLSEAERRRVRVAEAETMADPGIAFAISRPLLMHLQAYRSPRRLHLLPNVGRLVDEGDQGAHPFEDMPRPLIGLIGEINERYDFELLAHVADRLPAATVLIAGRVAMTAKESSTSGFDDLVRRPNVRVTGAISSAQMSRMPALLDVGLLPYRRTPANEHGSPGKVYDYLQAHTPCVSSGVPDLDSASRWVRQASEPAAFVEAVREALAGGRLDETIDPWLKQNTSEARAEDALAVLAAVGSPI